MKITKCEIPMKIYFRDAKPGNCFISMHNRDLVWMKTRSISYGCNLNYNCVEMQTGIISFCDEATEITILNAALICSPIKKC